VRGHLAAEEDGVGEAGFSCVGGDGCKGVAFVNGDDVEALGVKLLVELFELRVSRRQCGQLRYQKLINVALLSLLRVARDSEAPVIDGSWKGGASPPRASRVEVGSSECSVAVEGGVKRKDDFRRGSLSLMSVSSAVKVVGPKAATVRSRRG